MKLKEHGKVVVSERKKELPEHIDFDNSSNDTKNLTEERQHIEQNYSTSNMDSNNSTQNLRDLHFSLEDLQPNGTYSTDVLETNTFRDGKWMQYILPVNFILLCVCLIGIFNRQPTPVEQSAIIKDSIVIETIRIDTLQRKAIDSCRIDKSHFIIIYEEKQ